MFGAIAVAEGLLPPERLEEALHIQRKWADGRPLGEVLVELGRLSPEQRDRVLDIQAMTERRRRDALLGRIGVLNKFYTEEQLRGVLRRPGGRIGQRLKAAGLVTDEQLEAMLRTQKRLLAESERAPDETAARTFELVDRDAIVVGRDPSCDVRLDDREVSRRHCRLSRRGGRTVVEDLGSLYGVFVNGTAVTGPTELSDGDTLMIGRTILAFHEPTAAPRARRLVRPRRGFPVGVAIAAAAMLVGLVFIASLPERKPPKSLPVAAAPERIEAPEPVIDRPRDFELEEIILEEPAAVEPEPLPVVEKPPVEEAPVETPTVEAPAPEVKPAPLTESKPDYDRFAREVRTASRERATSAARTLAGFGDEGRSVALDAASARREKIAARIRGWKLPKKLEETRRLRLHLFELRLAAILAIADAEDYTKEKGQSDVDRRVQELRRFYQANLNRGLGALPAKGRAALEEYDWCDALVVELGGTNAGDDSLTAARRLTAGPVIVGTLELPWERQGLAAYNRRVRELNAERRREISGAEYDLVVVLNDYREMQGRHRLLIDPALCRAARGHSEEMAKLNTLDHFSPDAERRTPDQRARLAGFEGGGIGENILSGSGSGGDAHERWYNSAPHHRNMLRLGYTDIGVGTSGGYWTELFGAVYREEQP